MIQPKLYLAIAVVTCTRSTINFSGAAYEKSICLGFHYSNLVEITINARAFKRLVMLPSNGDSYSTSVYLTPAIKNSNIHPANMLIGYAA